MSTLSLLVNVILVGVYGFAAYFMTFDTNLQKMGLLMPPELRIYGQLKYLTFQCLLIQLLSSLLHVGAHFSRLLVKPRDLVFTTLAYPVGSIVVYSFWAVWHVVGRELIFPQALGEFFPDWLNHVTHSIIAPLNILLALAVDHKYSRGGALVTVGYTSLYLAFLLLIKQQTGLFVYKYLDAMSDVQRALYFLVTGLLAYLLYKSGQLLAAIAHGKAAPQRPPARKQKLK